MPKKDTVAAQDSITELQNYQEDCFKSLLSVVENNVQTNTPSDPPRNRLIDDAYSTKSATETELNRLTALKEKMQKISSGFSAPVDLSKLDKKKVACFKTMIDE